MTVVTDEMLQNFVIIEQSMTFYIMGCMKVLLHWLQYRPLCSKCVLS